ncbi:hypothetical protein AWZ03_013689 [Drosophila navojoa]|uniref:Aldehyde dehydrogenase domain-containing protein n=1 Tax=Drosophila navojoa TaxID=7232 RepID=A0A484ATF2_DRONA|nr:uncharacterized protein LOC108656224 [Drosophila navojoa]TDG39889.1 hypothetical protein AWZ03_013689 [Drosophila navojoa]
MPNPEEGDQRISLERKPISAKTFISYNMVHKLECKPKREISLPVLAGETTTDGGEPQPPKYQWQSPSMLIVFEGGDLNSARHHLLSSLHDPFGKHAVATVLIQESVRDVFIELLIQSMKPLDPKIYNHPNYVRSKAKLAQCKAETIVGDPKVVPAHASPTLVCDLSDNFLGDEPTGIIIMHTFRTPRDATLVLKKETIKYGFVSIWNEKVASAYEICALLKNDIFMINCFNVDLTPILPKGDSFTNDVRIEKGYHYERLILNHQRKIIVFAVGAIFAN